MISTPGFKKLTCVGLLSVGLFTGRADAATITLAPGSAQSFDVGWSEMVGGTELAALGAFTVTVSDTYVDFLITLTNNTALWNERAHSIGFNTNPNGTSLTNTLAGNYFRDFALDRTFPGYQRVDICAWTGGNCAGGAQTNNLPGLGQSDTFGFRLNGDFTGGVELGTFAIKFMGDLGSYEFEGDIPPPRSVPEPMSILLVGVGLVASAAARRRLTS